MGGQAGVVCICFVLSSICSYLLVEFMRVIPLVAAYAGQISPTSHLVAYHEAMKLYKQVGNAGKGAGTNISMLKSVPCDNRGKLAPETSADENDSGADIVAF